MAPLWIVSSLIAIAGEREPGNLFHVRHQVLAQLGKEHVAATAWRRTRQGGRIVAWGSRVLEWQLGTRPVQREVVPAREGLEYSNGGCAVDVDGDGVEEVVVARTDLNAEHAVDLVWLKARSGQKRWEEHPVASLGKGRWIFPHDIQPFAMRSPAGKPLRGVVFILDRRKLVWYRIPSDPMTPWEPHEIAILPGPAQ